MKQIIEYIFGVKASGERIPHPIIKTVEPTHRPSENDWAKEFKFGSRYGHRGSFYHA